jgi:hypothetical protein
VHARKPTNPGPSLINYFFMWPKQGAYFRDFTVSHVKATLEVFIVHLSSFPWRVGGHTREQISLVQNLAWLALEQGFLARKKVNFFPYT